MNEKAIFNGVEHRVKRSRHLNAPLVYIALKNHQITETEQFKKKIMVFDAGKLQNVLTKEELEQCYTEQLYIPYRVCRRDN